METLSTTSAQNTRNFSRIMKRIFIILLAVITLGLFVWTGFFLYQKSEKPPVVFKTASAFTADIVKKSVATGSIKPEVEVNVKPQVTGIIEQLFVEAGQYVTFGQPIARIKIVPNVVQLNNAEQQVKRAEINLENGKRELDRNEELYKKKVISEADYRRFVLTYELAKQELESAKNNLQLVREGASAAVGQGMNVVTATMTGLCLDVPVKVGGSVIERNNFNEGTTVATIADMNTMMFYGKVDESEVGKLREGMMLKLTVGAIENQSYEARLVYISPKGNLEEGAIKFEIRAAVILRKDAYVRAGYSANADIIVGKKEKVLAVKESDVIFKNDSTFVELETSQQTFKKHYVKLGLSDGINIEVVEGLKAADKYKVLGGEANDDKQKKN